MINSRCPELLDGDLRAMLGATRVGADELRKVIDDFGLVETVALFGEILDYADRRLRAAILELPDGVYRAEERYDNDCFSAVRVALRMTLTKSADRITVDFTGTDPQIRGFKNSSLANTYSAVYAGIASFFDSDLPRNEGTFRSVSIVAPRGSVVNAVAPAPLTMCTVFPAHEIMHMVWWALGQADPKRSIAGWGKNVFPVTSGRDAESATWVMYNWGGNSGAGAVAGRDGFNQMGPMVTLGGLVIPNMETYEQLYPITVRRHELRTDGGGPGCHRGGTGVEFEVDIEGAAEYSFRGEGTTRPTGLGVEAGQAGAIGEVRITGPDGPSYSPDPYCLKELGPVRLTIRSPGGGGFGRPFDRPVELVVRDVHDGLVSRAAAESDYGVVLGCDDCRVDVAATERLRRERCVGS
jgi:N-methylhydantoinase B